MGPAPWMLLTHSLLTWGIIESSVSQLCNFSLLSVPWFVTSSCRWGLWRATALERLVGQAPEGPQELWPGSQRQGSSKPSNVYHLHYY